MRYVIVIVCLTALVIWDARNDWRFFDALGDETARVVRSIGL